jgi:hypothetical protein
MFRFVRSSSESAGEDGHCRTAGLRQALNRCRDSALGYGAGLRAGEVVRLRVGDIDSPSAFFHALLGK